MAVSCRRTATGSRATTRPDRPRPLPGQSPAAGLTPLTRQDMTLPTDPGPAMPGPVGDGQERVSESALASSLSRLAAWVAHAPAERAPAAGIPAVWTAAEVMHAAALSPVLTRAATVAAAGLAVPL